jgi:hypothetical protein
MWSKLPSPLFWPASVTVQVNGIHVFNLIPLNGFANVTRQDRNWTAPELLSVLRMVRLYWVTYQQQQQVIVHMRSIISSMIRNKQIALTHLTVEIFNYARRFDGARHSMRMRGDPHTTGSCRVLGMHRLSIPSTWHLRWSCCQFLYFFINEPKMIVSADVILASSLHHILSHAA